MSKFDTTKGIFKGLLPCWVIITTVCEFGLIRSVSIDEQFLQERGKKRGTHTSVEYLIYDYYRNNEVLISFSLPWTTFTQLRPKKTVGRRFSFTNLVIYSRLWKGSAKCFSYSHCQHKFCLQVRQRTACDTASLLKQFPHDIGVCGKKVTPSSKTLLRPSAQTSLLAVSRSCQVAAGRAWVSKKDIDSSKACTSTSIFPAKKIDWKNKNEVIL
jgi:hypothetical protein